MDNNNNSIYKMDQKKKFNIANIDVILKVGEVYQSVFGHKYWW
jgi:hypothetical protein